MKELLKFKNQRKQKKEAKKMTATPEAWKGWIDFIISFSVYIVAFILLAFIVVGIETLLGKPIGQWFQKSDQEATLAKKEGE